MSLWQKVTQTFLSDIVKNSAKLLSASIIVQIIGLLVYPILTRLYSPEDFGLINLFLSLSGVLALFATAEFQYSILLPKSEEKAIACFHIGSCIALIVFILLLSTIPFANQIAQLFNAPNLADWYWAIPIFVLFSAFWTLLNYWYTRQKQFGEICTYQVTQCLTNAGAKCGFGCAGIINGGLIYSALLSPFIALIISTSRNIKNGVKKLFSFNKTKCISALHEYSNFPKYSLPRALINYLSGNLPIFLLTPFFGLTEIGFFGMALTLAFRPLNMISNSFYQVLFQKTSELVQNNQSVRFLIFNFLKYTAFIVISGFSILYFILPQLTTFLLGFGWAETGTYIQIMLCWLTVSMLVAPICYISDIFQKQKIGLFFEISLVIARIIGLLWGICTNNFLYAIIGYCIGSAIVISLQLLWYISLVKNYERSIAVS